MMTDHDCGGRCNKCVAARRAAEAEAASLAGPASVASVSAPAPAAATEQALPARSDRPAVQDMVVADVRGRKLLGLRKYGTVLQAFNGRSARLDAYQEALDLVMYLRQDLAEQDEILTAFEELVCECEEQGMQVEPFREVLNAAALRTRTTSEA